jgi:hypothetical protein
MAGRKRMLSTYASPRIFRVGCQTRSFIRSNMSRTFAIRSLRCRGGMCLFKSRAYRTTISSLLIAFVSGGRALFHWALCDARWR